MYGNRTSSSNTWAVLRKGIAAGNSISALNSTTSGSTASEPRSKDVILRAVPRSSKPGRKS
jgi:hypothetical protein